MLTILLVARTTLLLLLRELRVLLLQLHSGDLVFLMLDRLVLSSVLLPGSCDELFKLSKG